MILLIVIILSFVAMAISVGMTLGHDPWDEALEKWVMHFVVALGMLTCFLAPVAAYLWTEDYK